MNKDPAYRLKICLSKIISLTISKKIIAKKPQQFPKKRKNMKKIYQIYLSQKHHRRKTRELNVQL